MIEIDGKRHDIIDNIHLDGFNDGFKPMQSKIYSGKYELGLLINGTNTPQLLQCLSATKNNSCFEGVIQITEIVGKDHFPVCGVETYAKEAESIANYAAQNCAWIKQIEISVGALGIDTGVPKCRFERYFEDKLVGTCPHNKVASECGGCFFQKQVYVRK